MKAISTMVTRCSFDPPRDGIQPALAAHPGEGAFNTQRVASGMKVSL